MGASWRPMKLTVSRSDLIRLLSVACVVAPSKSERQALTCVLLENDPRGIRATATDLYQSISTICPAQGSLPSPVVVCAKDLLDRVKTLGDWPIDLSVDKDKLRVTAGKRKHALPIFPIEEYPAVSLDHATTWTVSAGVLLRLLVCTRPMATTEAEDRPQLHAVLVSRGAGATLLGKATDGRRLSIVELASLGAPEQPLLIPVPAIDAIRAIVKDENVDIGSSASELFVRTGDVTFASKLIAGAFPDVSAIVPPDANQAAARCNRQLFADSIRSAAIASELAQLKLTLSPGTIRVEAEGKVKGEAFDEIDADYEGAETIVGCDAKLILDALATCESVDVRLNIGGELEPIWIREADSEVTKQCVMPQRMGDA